MKRTTYRVEIFKGKANRGQSWYFRVRHRNGRIIGQSEAYHNAADAKGCADLIAKGPGASRLRMRMFDEGNSPWWALIARNGEHILTSETYTTNRSAMNTVSRLMLATAGDFEVRAL